MAEVSEKQVKMLVDFGWKEEDARGLSMSIAREILIQAVANRKPTDAQIVLLIRSGLTYDEAKAMSFEDAKQHIADFADRGWKPKRTYKPREVKAVKKVIVDKYYTGDEPTW